MTKSETEEENFKVELALNERYGQGGRGGGGAAERRKTGWSRKVNAEKTK